MALVAGPANSGRSALAGNLQAEARRRGWTTLAATATPELREVPRGLLLKALRPIIEQPAPPGGDSATVGTAPVGLQMALVPLLGEPERRPVSANPRPAPQGPLRAAAPGPGPYGPVTGEDVEVFLLDRLRGASERSPVLLVVEDLEWADDLSFWLLRRLLRQRSFPRTLILSTLDRDQESRVPPGLLVDPGSPFLWQRCELSPREAPSPGPQVSSTGPVETEEERDQALLGEAAVLGTEFSEELLSQVSGVPLDQVASSLARSEHRGRLIATESGFRFPSRDLWSWALGDHPAAIRRRHLRTAQVLEQLYPTPSGRVVFDLARHYEQAGVHSKAFQYLLRSAEIALETGATREAEGRFLRALALVAHLPPHERAEAEVMIYRRLADSERLLGNQEAAVSAIREGLARTTRAQVPAREVVQMEVVMARVLQDLGKPEETAQALASAEEHAEASRDRSASAVVAARRAVLLGLQGREAEALATLERADSLLPEGAPPAERALVEGTGFDLWFMGVLKDLERARVSVQRARTSWERAGLPFEALRTLDHEALVADAAGDWEGALKAYHAFAVEAERAGFVLLMITGRGNEAETLAELGRLDEARDALERARRGLSLLDDVRDDSQIDLVSALIAWKEGAGGQAVRDLDRAIARLAPAGRAEITDQLVFLKARILYDLGRTEEARSLLQGLTTVNPVLRSPRFHNEWAKILGQGL